MTDKNWHIANAIDKRATDLSHRAWMTVEGRVLDRDAQDCLTDLEELTRLIKELYEIRVDGSSQQSSSR